MRVIELKCEYQKYLIGTDVRRPRLSWNLAGDIRGENQVAYRILVSEQLELLKNDIGEMWDSGVVESNDTIHITYDGKDLKSSTRYYFKVQVWNRSMELSESEISWWETGLLDQSEWRASWIGLPIEESRRKKKGSMEVGLPAPYLRKSFYINRAVKKARVYVSSLGIYKLFINGELVSGDCFNPGWTDYNKRIQYQTYDVTQILKDEENVVGSIIGDGWYCGNIANIGRQYYGDYPLGFIMQLQVDYEDGTSELITSDDSWKAKEGPIVYSDIIMGEMYDANKELSGWNEQRYSDIEWNKVEILDKVKGELVAQVGPTVKVNLELKPITINEHLKGVYIFDMGQNMVGWQRIKVKGSKGNVIKMRFGEMLQKDGSLYTENLRNADQTDYYILKGQDEEIYEPSFTYHGFRYVEVTGLTEEPTIDTLIGRVAYSDTALTGGFSCSNDMVNKLFENILWGQRGNFFSIPTDCPQRDERLGWTGDSVNFVRTANLNMDCHGFYTKYITDIVEAQYENGAYTDVAPQVEPFNKGNGAWGDAGIVVPWSVYQSYKDTRILEENYDSMKRWIEYLKENSTELIRPELMYGDWLSINAETPKDLVNTAYFAYSTQLFSKIAGVLGRHEDAEKYRRLFEDIKLAYNKKFVTDDGKVQGETQTAYVLSLAMDLLPEKLRKKAAEYLVEDIESRGVHLSTGFVAIAFILPVLCEFGYEDIAYKLVNNDTYPSWGYSIKNGATTIWERWNSYTIENGFGDASMNSYNHYSFGSVGEWLYKYAAGIKVCESAPGYKHTIIEPFFNETWEYAAAEYKSVYGLIKSSWKREDGNIKLSISIPANTAAEVRISFCKDIDMITEGNKDIRKSKGIEIIKAEDNKLILHVVSGVYEFALQEHKSIAIA